jgi:hypothetical protein
MRRHTLRRRYGRAKLFGRKVAGHVLRTQADVEMAIARLAALAHLAEVRRDRAPYESKEYWKEHDIAVMWRKQAEALMPSRGARR